MITQTDDLHFQIMSVLRVKHKSGVFTIAARPYAALSLRVSGSAGIEVGGELLEASIGDILYIPEGMAYKAEYTESEMIVVHLLGCNYTEPEVITPLNSTLVESFFAGMLKAWETKCTHNYIKSQIYALFDALSRETEMGGDTTAFMLALEYIDTHFTDPTLSVETVCRVSYLCRSTLQRRFQRRFGMSPQQYITKLRLERALVLLAGGKLTVGEVSRASGFADEKYFSRTFKKRYGFSPIKARKDMLV